jgi:cyclophilin family peptidyl-prolyl cis-trans isomerase
MSAVYATEPPFSGKVVLETTHGPLELQLWGKECPETVRHFVRRCVDGFYDDTAFHRIVPKFLIQAGAIRNQKHKQSHRSVGSNADDSTTVQEALEKDALVRRQHWASYESYRASIEADRALERRKYEVHSRLRFSHRGIVAMALTVQEDPHEDGGDDNAELMQPQFFVALDEATFLDGKHVIFGSCTGPTYFNAVRISQVDVDEATGTPHEWNDAPRILRARVVELPPHLEGALVPQSNVPWKLEDSVAGESQKKSKKKRKGKLDVNVLSFGDEVLAADDLPVVSLSRVSEAKRAAAEKSMANVDEAAARSQLRVAKTGDDSVPANRPPGSGSDDPMRDSQRDGPSLRRAPTTTTARAPAPAGASDRTNGSTGALDDTGDGHREESAPVSQHPHGKGGSIVEMRKRQFAARRAQAGKVRTPSDNTRRPRDEDDTMAKLMAFQSNLKRTTTAATSASAATIASSGGGKGDTGGGLASRMARRAQQQEASHDRGAADLLPTYHGQVLENDDDDDEPKEEGKMRNDWMRTQFRCRRSAGDVGAANDALVGGDGRHADDYQVVDDRDRRQNRSHRDDGSGRAGREHDKSKKHKSDRPSHDRHRHNR